MNTKLELKEKCPCCGGKLHHKPLDKIVEGGFAKSCFVCALSIENFSIGSLDEGTKLVEPYLHKGYGCLTLSLDGKSSSGIFVDKDYSNIEYLIEVANKEVSNGWASLEHSYLYKFNPETNTGEFVWGNYNPLLEDK